MQTKVMTDRTIHCLLTDVTYCDGCKKAIDMNMAIKDRATRCKGMERQQHKVFTMVDNDGDSDIEYHYCEECMKREMERLIAEDYIDIRIKSDDDGVVIQAELDAIEEEEKRRAAEAAVAKAELERQKQAAIDQSVREEEEMLRDIFGDPEQK